MLNNTLLVIPTYNERNNIGKLVAEIFLLLPDLNVMVVDDSSPDGTADAVRALRSVYPNLSIFQRPEKNGLGRAYVEAFQKVLSDDRWKFIITMDADFSHHPKYLPRMLELAKDKDLVVGSRYVSGGGTVGWERWRMALSYFGNLYCRYITGLPLHDLTGGYCCCRAEKLSKIDWLKLDSSGYAFLMQLKYQMIKCGSTYVEMPIIFYNRIEGESKISSHIIKEGLWAPWKMKFKK